jgi:hypothetical protein
MREAAARFQRSPLGARNHARRQKRYRHLLLKKVTHQGSPLQPPAALLPAESCTAAPALAATPVKVSQEEPASPGVEAPQVQRAMTQEASRSEIPQAPRNQEVETLRLAPTAAWLSLASASHCHFCGRASGALSRLDFVRVRRR